MKMIGRTLAALALTFAMAGCQAMTGKTAGRNVDDATITGAVKSKLAADKLSSVTRIDVDTDNGVVSLNGVVESPEQKSRAAEIAEHTGGVTRVVNNLQVQRTRTN